MSGYQEVPLSVLDLTPVPQGFAVQDAFRFSLALAQQSEKLGFHRYWLAEHHNMAGIASAATAVLIGYLAANTTRLHLGSGGVMLPNHPPLIIAEQFGTLISLYPERIELGLGRAPGSDQATMQALRRHHSGQVDSFPEDVKQLIAWFDYLHPDPPAIRPVPGLGLKIPVWLLGSSLYSAHLAAKLGVPFAFASHFAPDMMFQALHLYRKNFQPSSRLDKPYAMVCVNIIAADSDDDARFLFTSAQQQFINLRRGKPTLLPAPVTNMDSIWTPAEKYAVEQTLSTSIIGCQEKVRQGLISLLRETKADEIMANGQIFDLSARLHSFSLAKAAHEAI